MQRDGRQSHSGTIPQKGWRSQGLVLALSTACHLNLALLRTHKLVLTHPCSRQARTDGSGRGAAFKLWQRQALMLRIGSMATASEARRESSLGCCLETRPKARVPRQGMRLSPLLHTLASVRLAGLDRSRRGRYSEAAEPRRQQTPGTVAAVTSGSLA